MKILTFNARVWTRDTQKSSPYFWKKRMEAMKKMINDIKPDVMCLQEMSFPATLYIPSGYKKVGISASHHIFCKKGLKVGSSQFNIYWNYADIECVKIISVHGTWKERMEDVSSNILRKAGNRAIIAGDFNIGLGKCKEYGFTRSAREILGLQAEDTFANFNRPEESHGEIDHVFVPGYSPRSYRVIRNGYGATRISDHYPVLVEI